MDLSLDGVEALRQLLEVATGESYHSEVGAFGEPHDNVLRAFGLRDIMGDADKESTVRKALKTAGTVECESGRAKRMKIGHTAISRRVTASKAATFGYQPRAQAYGRRRWKTHTGALVAAEREARRNNNNEIA